MNTNYKSEVKTIIPNTPYKLDPLMEQHNLEFACFTNFGVCSLKKCFFSQSPSNTDFQVLFMN